MYVKIAAAAGGKLSLGKVADHIYIGMWSDCNLQMPTIHLDDTCTHFKDDTTNRCYTLWDEDKDASTILKILDDCESFIDLHRKTGILIHCAAGISRSPTLAFLYLCRKGEIRRYADFKAIYPAWHPNMGFQAIFQQLGVD